LKTLLQNLKNILQRRQRYLSLKANRLLKNPRQLFLTIFGISAFVFLGYALVSNLAVSYGNSIDKKLFWKVNSEKIERGDYVLVQTDREDIFAKGHIIAKIIGCSEREVLEIEGDEYYCNGDYLGRAKHQSRTGITVKPFNPCGTVYCLYKIPENQYFIIGTHRDSYDSRYFGPVRKDKILARLLPIW